MSLNQVEVPNALAFICFSKPGGIGIWKVLALFADNSLVIYVVRIECQDEQINLNIMHTMGPD